MTPTCRILGTLVALLAATSAVLAQAPADPYRDVLTYQFGQPRTALATVEEQIRTSKPEELPAIEAELFKVLQNPAATADCKDWVCRQLRQVGSERAVPALTPLLADKQLSTVARLALQSIPGVKVDEALREVLGKLPGDLKAGVIQSLGARGDHQAVPLLAPLAGDKDPVVAEMALYALGHIGGPEALKAVQAAAVPETLNRYKSHAVLLIAEGMASAQPAEAAAIYQGVYRQSGDAVIKTAALRGIVLTDKANAGPVVAAALKSDDAKLRLAAAKFVCELGRGDMLRTALADLGSLSADTQLAILGLVNDKAAMPAVLATAKATDETIRVAALTALGRVGDASNAAMLLQVAATGTGALQAAARQSLQQLRGAEVDQALMGIVQAGEPATCAEAIRALAVRSATIAVPLLLKVAAEGQAAVQAEAFGALGVLAETDALPAVVKLLVEGRDDPQRAGAEKALAAICRRVSDKDAAAAAVLAALPGPSVELRCALVRVLARIPSGKALEALRAAAGEADASVNDAAIRGLADWPDASVATDLLTIARSSQSQVHKVLALRGVIRVAGLAGLSAEVKVKLLGEALSLAARPDEKKLALGALAEVNHPAALELAAGCLSQKEIEVEAATAVVAMAKNLRKTDINAAAAAVQKVLDVCQTPAARQLAESAMIVVDKMVNIAPSGTATSPDDLEKDGGSHGDQAAIDGKPDTYWDEADGKPLYRLVVTFKQPERVGAISLVGYEQHSYAPKDFEILCDGKAVKKVANAQYDANFLVIRLDETTCTTLELKITGCYGASPAIRELGIYRPQQGEPKP